MRKGISPALRANARALLDNPAFAAVVQLTTDHLCNEWQGEDDQAAREALFAQVKALQAMIVTFRKMANGLAKGVSDG